jgi:hypothetical protein
VHGISTFDGIGIKVDFLLISRKKIILAGAKFIFRIPLKE